MKILHAFSTGAAVLFVALGVACALLDFSVRQLRIDVAAQEQQLHAAEAQTVELARALQATDGKKEAQEQANEALREKIVRQQTAIQTQQEQINRGTQISQQLGPNLLHDIANASLKNDKLKALLARNGYTVQSK